MGAGSLSTALHSGLAEAQASGATHAYPNEHASLKKTCDKNTSIASVSDVLAFRRQWLLDAKAHKNQAYVHHKLAERKSYAAAAPLRTLIATLTASSRTNHRALSQQAALQAAYRCEDGLASVKTHSNSPRLRRRQRTKCNKRARAAGMRRRPRANSKRCKSGRDPGVSRRGLLRGGDGRT